MLKRLKELNPQIEFYNVTDKEFALFGKIVKDLDVSEIIKVAKNIPNPQSGSKYTPSFEEFEFLKIASDIENEYFGFLPTQIGYCWGYNNKLDATEWHTSSEINIAVTPLVLILGSLLDVSEGKIHSSKFKAFYLPKGTAVEVYATSLHYCPCQVSDSGFGCVVGLPLGTNTELTIKPDNQLLFAKNKWLIAHNDADDLKSCGAYVGISGINYEIKY